MFFKPQKYSLPSPSKRCKIPGIRPHGIVSNFGSNYKHIRRYADLPTNHDLYPNRNLNFTWLKHSEKENDIYTFSISQSWSLADFMKQIINKVSVIYTCTRPETPWQLCMTPPRALHMGGPPKIWIDQSGFSMREKPFRSDVNVS